MFKSRQIFKFIGRTTVGLFLFLYFFFWRQMTVNRIQYYKRFVFVVVDYYVVIFGRAHRKSQVIIVRDSVVLQLLRQTRPTAAAAAAARARTYTAIKFIHTSIKPPDKLRYMYKKNITLKRQYSI